jgi:hypothetical protein
MFSLKPADATSTGGRSLLVPTPFSIKMALLDVALRIYGLDVGSQHFPLIRDLALAISPPPQIVVNNCFMRIHKPRRGKSGRGEEDGESGEDSEGESSGPFILSVALREYVHYNGPLGLSAEVTTNADADVVRALMIQVSYFGKRGGLFQIDSPPLMLEQLPIRQGYLRLDNHEPVDIERRAGATLQALDDCSPKLTFAKANIYSGESISLGKDRILRHVVLPYRLTRSSRGFTLYERIAG